jgi:hypothetical protein
MANSAAPEDTFAFVVGITYIDSHSDLRGGINTAALNDEDSLKSYFLERVSGQGRAR